MVAVLGEKLFELAVLTLAFAPLLPHELAGLVELPHADANSAPTATTPIIARISLLQCDEEHELLNADLVQLVFIQLE